MSLFNLNQIIIDFHFAKPRPLVILTPPVSRPPKLSSSCTITFFAGCAKRRNDEGRSHKLGGEEEAKISKMSCSHFSSLIYVGGLLGFPSEIESVAGTKEEKKEGRREYKSFAGFGIDASALCV